MSRRPTGFLGMSHLGIISGIGWASLGSSVVAVDLEAEPVDRLRRGELPVHEPSLPELFAASRDRMTFSTDPSALAACDLVVVSRDIPTDSDNGSDPSVVDRLIDAAIPHLRPESTLVLMSQVSPGSTRALAARVKARRPEAGIAVYYWVETLIFGNAVERFLKPERIIVGAEDPARPLPSSLDAGLRRFGCPILPMGYESAELTKTAINLYLFGAVTYANTLADLCEAVGANWSEMVPALRLDRRIGPAAYIRPSLGVAGGNLERDLVTLRGLGSQHGVDVAYVDTLLAHNARRYRWIQRQLDRRVLDRDGRAVVAVWGLAYKKNSRSTKNSVSLRLLGDLAGRATVTAYDPQVTLPAPTPGVATAATALDAARGADALVILTDWDEFAAVDPGAIRAALRSPVVLDAVGVLDPVRTRDAGLTYVAIGEAP